MNFITGLTSENQETGIYRDGYPSGIANDHGVVGGPYSATTGTGQVDPTVGIAIFQIMVGTAQWMDEFPHSTGVTPSKPFGPDPDYTPRINYSDTSGTPVDPYTESFHTYEYGTSIRRGYWNSSSGVWASGTNAAEGHNWMPPAVPKGIYNIEKRSEAIPTVRTDKVDKAASGPYAPTIFKQQSAVCVSGGVPKYSIGERVSLTHPHQFQAFWHTSVSGAYNDIWSASYAIDFGYGRVTPFTTGTCLTGVAGMCNYYFSTPSGASDSTGVWYSAGSTCDCPCVTFPDPNYIGADNDATGISCSTSVTGCNVLTNCWTVKSRNWGGAHSVGNRCKWGYVLEFVGDPSGSTVCKQTGSFPPATGSQLYIPESYVLSTSRCN